MSIYQAAAISYHKISHFYCHPMFANDSPPAVILSGAKDLDVCIVSITFNEGE
jgi:hypothetical protein